MMKKDYDFCGWATKNDIKCSDGRIIRRDAFKHNDGMSVPLVYSHKHDTIANVLGHAILVNKPDGMYAYGYLNHSSEGEAARERVKNRDITRMSIYATQVRQNGADVIHGDIKEVSLVISGANPGATIETVLSHSDIGIDEESVIIKTGEDLCLSDPDMEAVREEGSEVIEHADEKKDEGEKKESDEGGEDGDEEGEGKTIGDVLDTMTPLQKKACYALVSEFLDAIKRPGDSDDDDEDEDEEDGEDAKHDDLDDEDLYISQSDIDAAFADFKRYGTMKAAFEAHGIGDIAHADPQGYGIEGIEDLYPDYHPLNRTPEIINYEEDWVSVVLNGVHRLPYARVKSLYADITGDEARAKGYVKGNLKTEQVISLLKRETKPTTIYKKQRFDRDDLIDADMDVIAFIKAEMRRKLNEEIARAILFSDGRGYASEDKISELNIRPIVSDSPLYTINWTGHYEVPSDSKSRNDVLEFTQRGGLIPDFILRDIIRGSRAARVHYRGANPIMFCSAIMHESFLLMEDKRGHLLYEDDEKLRKVLRVNRIVVVPDEVLPITNIYDPETGAGRYNGVFAVIVNLADYDVGMDRGGNVAMFDKFDIDYNQQKYLIETRMSGALVKPYSAIAMALNITFPEVTSQSQEDPEEINLDPEEGETGTPGVVGE